MIIDDWEHIQYFAPEEFDDPLAPGSGRLIDMRTVYLLDRLRAITGWPIITHNRHGLRGCVCVRPRGHSAGSTHYLEHPEGPSAVDFHFATDEDARAQAMYVLRAGFPGIGIYQLQGQWPGIGRLPVWFHVDHRKSPQVWKREGGEYVYLLR